MSDNEILLNVLSAINDCSSRASTASAIAKKVSTADGCGKCSTAYVEKVLAVLDKLPYVEVLRKPSGRLAGLNFKSGTEGACSIYYVRISPGYTLYYHGNKTVKRVDDRDDFQRSRAAIEEMKVFAAQHHLPMLNFLSGGLLESVLPFVQEALAAAVD